MYMCSVILPSEGLVVVQKVIIVGLVIIAELDIVKELGIVVITVTMGTGDPIIRVVIERILLLTTDPQIFPALIFT